jgi:hypothetical protein
MVVGIVAAENEILWWEGSRSAGVIQQGLQQMWQGGPTGEHSRHHGRRVFQDRLWDFRERI